jgi:integrase
MTGTSVEVDAGRIVLVRIVTESGLRIYKELAPMKEDQVDLENRTVWIPDSKTPNGVAEVPLTEIAAEKLSGINSAFQGRALTCSRVMQIRTVISRRSRPFGMRRCGAQVFGIFASTISARRTRHGQCWRRSGRVGYTVVAPR